ncbi:MAG TPA: phytoene/squalene synthase family protein [Mycobacteriales bacterium]|nr:phytoene/squalene synthase family protein [Mycobacteriales bacterium]
MSRYELDAAGITDPRLRAAYRDCRLLNASHGRTYYLATMFLPPARRPHVHALYGFARYADEIVDNLDSILTGEQKASWLAEWGTGFLGELAGDAPSHPIRRAVIHTVRRFDIPVSHFVDFLASMRMDLTVTGYASYADLLGYMWGSAAVIGLEMLPILGSVCAPEVAAPYAADLGVAFQLSNFIRDVGEDLRRGRVYLPAEDLDAFGVDRARMAHGVVDGRVRRLLAFEIARTREVYRNAEPGIRLLDPTSRDCVRTAMTLYSRILDEVERADYRVLHRRVAVGPVRRAAVALPALTRAVLARHPKRHAAQKK